MDRWRRSSCAGTTATEVPTCRGRQRAAPTRAEFVANAQGNWTSFTDEKTTLGYNVLVAFVAGTYAEGIIGMTDQQARDQAVASLKAHFPNIPEPEDYIVSRWGQDPYALGAYSYHALEPVKTESGPGHRSDLAASLLDKVWFAGEACHPNYPSTTAGALLSGQVVGKRISLWL